MTQGRVTTLGSLVTPSAAASITLPGSGTPWVYGAWTQMIASTADALSVTALVVATVTQENWFEIQIGVGAAAAEAAIHTVKVFIEEGNVNNRVQVLTVPVALGGIDAGVRLSMRQRGSVTGTLDVALVYHEALDASHVTTSVEAMTAAPLGSAGVSITPNATSWANSSWVEVIAATTAESGMLGVITTLPVHGVAVEYDIGTGAAAAETVRSTVRCWSMAQLAGFHRNLWLPAPLPVPVGTRVSVRLRKSGTDTTAHVVSVPYIDGTSLL